MTKKEHLAYTFQALKLYNRYLSMKGKMPCIERTLQNDFGTFSPELYTAHNTAKALRDTILHELTYMANIRSEHFPQHAGIFGAWERTKDALEKDLDNTKKQSEDNIFDLLTTHGILFHVYKMNKDTLTLQHITDREYRIEFDLDNNGKEFRMFNVDSSAPYTLFKHEQQCKSAAEFHTAIVKLITDKALRDSLADLFIKGLETIAAATKRLKDANAQYTTDMQRMVYDALKTFAKETFEFDIVEPDVLF